jgi:hypothetical protein
MVGNGGNGVSSIVLAFSSTKSGYEPRIISVRAEDEGERSFGAVSRSTDVSPSVGKELAIASCEPLGPG